MYGGKYCASDHFGGHRCKVWFRLRHKGPKTSSCIKNFKTQLHSVPYLSCLCLCVVILQPNRNKAIVDIRLRPRWVIAPPTSRPILITILAHPLWGFARWWIHSLLYHVSGNHSGHWKPFNVVYLQIDRYKSQRLNSPLTLYTSLT